MNDLRKAAEQALEALGSDSISFKLKARVALRKALQEDNHESLRKAAWDRIAELEEALDSAVLAEREACAKVCEELIEHAEILGHNGVLLAAYSCATAIRARGEK